MNEKTLKETIGDYQFFSQVRIPRKILEDDTAPEKFAIYRWADNIARLSSSGGRHVTVYRPFDGSNRLLICGNHPNTQIAASLIRKTVIEICNGSFDSYETKQFVDKALQDFENEKIKAPPKLPSCRVDFKIAVADMNKRQISSFENMKTLFSSLDVEISNPEHCPTILELRSADKDALKSAKLTAVWVARTISKEQKVTKNNLLQTFEDQAIQALGRDRGTRMAQLAIV